MLNSDVLAKLADRLGGLPVLGCRPNSPAARAGIRYGDIVLSVNGRATPDWASYIEARGLAVGEMVVEFFRGGEIITKHLLLPEHTEPVDPFSLLEELMAARIGGSGGSGEADTDPS